MHTLAILPVKRFRNANHRLGAEYGEGSRSALARAMYSDVLAALRRCREVGAIVVVTRNRDAADLAASQGIAVEHEPEERGHSEAVRPVIDRASAQGYDRVLLVPADCPLASPGEIDSLLRRSATSTAPVTIVPDHHQTGTNALVMRPPGALEPQFGPDSLRRHLEQAKLHRVAARVDPVKSLGLDIDTCDDLTALRERLEGRHGGAASTRGVIRQLERLRRTAAPVA